MGKFKRLANLFLKLILDVIENEAKTTSGEWKEDLLNHELKFLGNNYTFSDLFQTDFKETLTEELLKTHIQQRKASNLHGEASAIDVTEAILQRPICIWRYDFIMTFLRVLF